MTLQLPLEGLSVIDFGDAWSSPFACTMLADAGADVVRVEDIHRQLSTLRGPVAPKEKVDGYPEREPGERPWNRYYLFNNSERNKLGITLDVRHPQARAILNELIAKCDIFATNYTPRATRHLGLTFDDLKRINPRIVYGHVTGYGCEGALANSVALGSTIDAWTGHMGLRGYPETTPHDAAMSYIADAAGAATLVLAFMAALEERDRTGEAQCIELALTEVLLEFLSQPLMQTVTTGQPPVVYGSRSPEWAPQGVYPCLGDDRWISIAARDDVEWASLCLVLGLSATEYPSAESRQQHHDQIDQLIIERTGSWGAEALMLALQESAVPAMVVYRDSEIFEHPEFTGGDFLEEARHPDTGMRLYPGAVWRSRNRPMKIRTPHFGLGEHNHEVICGQLGWSEEAYAALIREGAIGTKYSFWPSWPPASDASGRAETGAHD